MTYRKHVRKVTRMVRGNYYRAMFWAQDEGLWPGDNDYIRFICVSSARSGSTLLMRSLAQHPGVRAYGEIVRDHDRFADYMPAFYGTESLFETNPSAFLATRVFRKYPKSVEAVGFKIFYYHAPRNHAWGNEVWRFLLEQPQLNVIHLRRDNYLRAYVSRVVALESGEWIKYGNSTMDQGKLTLDIDDMLAYFTWRQTAEADFNQQFAEFPILPVNYESLVGDFDHELTRIQEFLGLQAVPMPQAIQKRPSKLLADQIANYDELTTRLSGTAWAKYLSD